MLRQSIFLSLLVDLISNIICFLQRPSPKHRFLIGHHKCRKVSTTHFAPLEQSARKATLVHLDEFHEVLQGQLFALDYLLVLGAQIGDSEQIMNTVDLLIALMILLRKHPAINYTQL